MSLLGNKNKPESCRVCGETNSAGWHCGTITCEACKKFFLRNSKSEYLEFKCVRSNSNCVITKSTRTNCPYCRYKKCLQVGMKQNEKVENDVVPFKEIPCTVCADSSSGLHFGAITCEGCKGFFRRNVKEGHKFVCNGDGNCEISFKSRNACRCCRYKKCVASGMDLKNCKIGRQSNLFKQKIKSIMDNGSDQSSTNQLDYIVNMNPQFNSTHRFNNVIKLHSNDCKDDIENLLDESTKLLVKKIFQAYQILENIQTAPMKVLNQEHEIAFELVRIHTEKCINFITNISFLDKFPIDDQKIILVNSIHPLRLLQLIRIQQTREQFETQPNMNPTVNYFNCDASTYDKISKYFPVFNQIMTFYKPLVDFVRELKLDSKEFALYSALLAFSTSCKGLKGVREKFDCSLELGNALSKYMYLRRSENESSERLINVVPRFERLNLQLQYSIYEKCNEFTKMGYHLDKFYETIFVSQFSFE